MSRWRDSIVELQQAATPAILVSVDSIVGSTPREPGAKMIVTGDHLYGTIGGGNLEFQACRIARDQLASGAVVGMRRFPLGAGLGQCCGGLVNLMFESLDSVESWARAETDIETLPVYLFGAGHVGQAVVAAMRELPLAIHWIDSRDGMFPPDLPDSVISVCTDTPEAEVEAAPAQCCFLVMTHDHAIDQSLCEQILNRDEFAYFGLIGSKSKRRMFETRMRRRGINPQCFERMTCPIGIDGISSKKPAVIAISVAAEIMQVYDQVVDSRVGLKQIKTLEGSG